MARLLFPDEGSRLIYRVSGTSLAAAPSVAAVFYLDSAATTLADIRVYDGTGTPGSAIAGSSVTTDAYSRLPLFWGPDGVDTLYAVVSGGPATAVYARADDRLDTLAAADATEAAARAAADATNAAAAAAAQTTANAVQVAARRFRRSEDLPVSVPAVADIRALGSVSSALTIPTYDGSGVAVHPSVLFFPDGWGGYRYWMAFTPYPSSNAEYENPSIVVSQGGDTWVVPPGVTNPLWPSPVGTAYNSDTHLAHGPDDRLYLFFRDYGTNGVGVSPTATGNRDRLLVMSSADGVAWTTPVVIVDTDGATQRILSPAVWYDPVASQWVMLGVDIVGTATIKRATSASPTSGWSAFAAVTVSPALARVPWHIDARLVDGTVVVLVQDNSSAGGNLYFLTSTDGGLTLTPGTRPVAYNHYRSSFVPRVFHSGLGFEVFASTLAGTNRRLLCAASPDVDAQHGALGVRPYTLGDTYMRADAATIGNAPTGQAPTVTNTATISGSAAGPGVTGTLTTVVYAASADGRTGIEHTVVPGGADQQYLFFRYSDASNYWRLGYLSAAWVLQKVQAGAVVAVTNGSVSAPAPAAGDVLSAEYRGSLVTAFINGAPFASVTDTFNQSATLVGWRGNNTAQRFRKLWHRPI